MKILVEVPDDAVFIVKDEPCDKCSLVEEGEKGFLSVNYESCEMWGPTMKANFCPNCGRKLRKDVEK